MSTRSYCSVLYAKRMFMLNMVWNESMKRSMKSRLRAVTYNMLSSQQLHDSYYTRHSE